MLRIKISCPSHPRYNPEQGEGAIRGACRMCSAMYQLYVTSLRVARQEWEERHTETEDEIA